MNDWPRLPFAGYSCKLYYDLRSLIVIPRTHFGYKVFILVSSLIQWTDVWHSIYQYQAIFAHVCVYAP